MSREEMPAKDEMGDVIDYLEEDPEIPTQRYAIISFLSPEKVIQQKEKFYVRKFIEWLEYDWKVKGMEHLMAFISKKYSIKVDDLMNDMQEFTKVHKEDGCSGIMGGISSEKREGTGESIFGNCWISYECTWCQGSSCVCQSRGVPELYESYAAKVSPRQSLYWQSRMLAAMGSLRASSS